MEQRSNLLRPGPRSALGGGLGATSLVLLFLFAATVPLAIAAWTQESSGNFANEFGAATAILGAALLYLQFLSSGRFEWLSGRIGIDRTMGFHRIAAYALVGFAVTHPLSYVASELLNRPSIAASRLQVMLISPWLRSGVVTLALLVVMVGFASLRTKPFVRYELWRAAHGPLALVCGGLTLHHAMRVGNYSANGELHAIWVIYALSALGAALLVYVVRPWRMWREGWRVESANVTAADITELVLRGPAKTRLHIRGGQFVWLTVFPNRPPLHDHPFSIASGANFSPRLRLLVRRAGDCTDGFHKIAPGTQVAIDGPHGSFVLPLTTTAIVMVAGGVGIAPLLGILEEAAEQGDKRPFRLLYGARSEASLVGRNDLARLTGRLDLKVTYCTDEACSTPGIVQGPICEDHLKALLSGLKAGDISALLCGPPGMMDKVSDAFLSLGIQMADIHYERFDYAAGRSRIDKRRRAIAFAILGMVVASAFMFSLR